MSRAVGRTLEAIGLPWHTATSTSRDGTVRKAHTMTAHDLRHVFGFVFLNERVDGLGEPLPAAHVAAMMGHTNPAFTLENYNRASTRAACRPWPA